MTVKIPERFADLLTRDKKAFAYLALVKSDGAPQVTPIWFDYDGTYFIFNTARGRVKDRIMHKHPIVAFVISDPDNAYRYVQISGRVVAESEEGAADGIRNLNLKYHGDLNYNIPPGQVRVTYKVLAERVSPNE